MLRKAVVSLGLSGVLLGCGLFAAEGVNALAQESSAPNAPASQTPAAASQTPAREGASQFEVRPAVVTSAVKAALPRVSVPNEVVLANGKLAREIKWQFGGKVQNGWHLYTSLIQQLIGTEAEPETAEFATALLEWKRNNGLPATAVLDDKCWVQMMTQLQRVRTYDHTPPPAEELVQISAEQWLYPERPAELRKLRRDAYEAYLRMIADARAELGASATGDYFKLVSGFRSAEYQAQLRAQAGNPTSTAGLARRSPHFSGRAIDLYVGGDPVSTKDANRAIQVATPAYKWLAKNAARYGFRPYFYEPWHWEFDPQLAAQNAAAR